MLTQRNMLGKSFHERQNRSVLNGPSPGQLGGHGLHPYSLNNQVCHLLDWRRIPHISQIRGCMRRKVAEIFKRKKEPSKELEQRALNFANVVENQLFLEAASKEEYENMKTLVHRMQIVVQRETRKKNLSQANYPSSGPNFSKMPTVRGCLKSDVPSLPFSYSKDSGMKCCSGTTNNSGQLAGRMVQSPEQASLPTQYTSVEELTGGGAIENGPDLFQSCITHTPSGSLNEHCQQQYFHQADGLNLASIRVYAENVQNSASMVYPSTNEQIVELSTSYLQDSQHVLERNSKISNLFPCMIPDTQSSTLEDALQPYLQLDRPKAQSQCYLGEQYGSCTQIDMENESNPPLPSKEQLDISPGMVSESWRSSLENVIQSQPLMLKFQGNQQLPKQAHLQSHNAFKLHQFSSEELNGATDGASENPALVSGCKETSTDAICSDQLRSSIGQGNLHCSPLSHKKHTQEKDLNGSPESNDSADILRPPKRQKMENLSGNGIPPELTAQIVQVYASERIPHLEQWPESPPSNSSEVKDANIELLTNSIKDRNDLTLIPVKVSISPDERIPAHMPEQRDSTEINEISGNVTDDSNRLHSESVLSASEIMDVDRKEEVLVQTNSEEAKLGFKNDLSIPQSEHEERWKSDNQNLIAASLIESFTAEQIKDHLSSLRQWNQVERGNSTISTVNENTCQLCLADRLYFAPTPIYCSVCFASIKRKVMYYCTPYEIAIPHCFCSKCYREVRGGSITVNGYTVSKKDLCKRINNEETDEPWVQCDTCEGWQHQICALYNNKTDLEGKAKYICPKCCLEEIETQKRTPLLETAVFRAKDLPSTVLSDHLELRLFRRLKEDREERARVTGKNLDEVPEAKDLVVRVVLSVDKRVTVKKQFLDIFQDQSYPEEFQYRSKVILLFQKIEGVDVCLFSMYVQEYGSECSHPNHRCVYISYLDSVKYFRPDIQSACGEALRTFVYHEILIGYLEYCKKIGFLTCYIWACPPVKGEDYILYCHPQVQKTPKSDKLRQWYHALLRKAAKENVVVDFTNLYDHFFVPTGEWKTKITAARIPYFDGDYWSGSVERWIRDIEKECGGDAQQVKKLMTNRTLKAMGLKDPSANATKDILIMQKLGSSIQPLKEDFIVVHLQYVCAQCHEVILSGLPWFCNQCPKFQLCERCHDSRESNTHTVNHKEEHLLHQVKVDDVPFDTNDKDLILANNLLENRHSFLSFCQTNHYQFDTVRRAKHSSMMILHELRDPTVLFVGSTCTICNNLTRADKSWVCETCPRFCICASCHEEKGDSSHPHKLIPHSSRPTCGTETKESQPKAPSIREFLYLIQHASQCHQDRSNPCTNQNCCKVKKMFAHASKCTLRLAGGCQICKKVWWGLSAHSRNCTNPDCRVPRCRDLKKNARNGDIVESDNTG